jgi:hypothetical protein
MYKDVRGSPIYDVAAVSTFSGVAKTEAEYVGFRLVYGVYDRVTLGGNWDDVSNYASVAVRRSRGPGLRRDYIGFRLCLDGR